MRCMRGQLRLGSCPETESVAKNHTLLDNRTARNCELLRRTHCTNR